MRSSACEAAVELKEDDFIYVKRALKKACARKSVRSKKRALEKRVLKKACA